MTEPGRVQACRYCGCTERTACVTDDGPCCWIDAAQTICSACVTSLRVETSGNRAVVFVPRRLKSERVRVEIFWKHYPPSDGDLWQFSEFYGHPEFLRLVNEARRRGKEQTGDD
ncbi:MAG TPA: hypothetical protein VNQ79_18630 [Blastocatellia bacterium]|nr:hypothetical protein [Blastocatellia bacterium]